MTPDLIEAATDLAAMLTEENAALGCLDLARAAAMAGAKAHAVDAFVGAQGRAAAAGATASREAQALAGQLQALAGENKRLLERAILVQGRVVAVVARALPAAMPGPRHYGAGGTLAAGKPRPMALSSRA